jgi:hypothetical protein
MIKRATLVILLLTLAFRAHGYQYWNDIRHSALLPGDSITIRVENPAGTGIENFLLYAGTGVEEAVMTHIADGPSTLTATVPGPVAVMRYYGFRLIQGDELDFMPVYLGEGADPLPEDLTRVAPDAAGDELFGYTNLDLVDCHVSFSDSRFYAALTNAGSGFPVIQGLTFFGYLLGIANPAVADPDTVFAIMHTFEQAGIISPGLYKITGTGLGNLTKIGEVTVQEFPASHQLLLSCELADLTADPYFQSWYDTSDPVLGVAAFTQRITLLGGAAEADRSPGGRCSLRSLPIEPEANQLPGLANLAVEGEGAAAYAEIEYSDANGHCPVLAEILFDGESSFPMYPVSLDYGLPVVYRTETGIEPLANGTWSVAAARFSDNESDIVELETAVTGILEDFEPGAAAGLRSLCSPNPFNATTFISFVLPEGCMTSIVIYDARGAVVRNLFEGDLQAGASTLIWDGTNDESSHVSTGVYFCRVDACDIVEVRKLLLIR